MQPRNTVLCIGVTPALQRTLQFDHVRRDEVNRALAVTTSPAGKGINVALVLSALGVRAIATGFAGGETGALVLRQLKARGVTPDFVATAAPTRICTTAIDGSDGTVTELVEEMTPPRPAEWRAFFARIATAIARYPLAVMAGALPPGVPATIYARLARLANGALCPMLIDSQKAPLLAALPARPLLAKLNAHELAATLDRPLHRESDVVRGARELIRRGAYWVLVTDGARPALLVSADRSFRIRPPEIRALNAVGSGDATTAGIAAALLDKDAMPDAVALGMACGAANAMTLTPADVDPRVARRLRRMVRVEERAAR